MFTFFIFLIYYQRNWPSMFLIPNSRRCQAGSGQCVIDKVKECFSNSCQIERILQNVVEEKKKWWPFLTDILLQNIGASKSVSSLSAKEMPPNGNEQRWWEKLKGEKKKKNFKNQQNNSASCTEREAAKKHSNYSTRDTEGVHIRSYSRKTSSANTDVLIWSTVL